MKTPEKIDLEGTRGVSNVGSPGDVWVAKTNKPVDKLEEDIKTYRKKLNKQGMVLFVATLGCWSVELKWLQVIAFLMTASFFFYELRQSCSELPSESFPKRISDLSKQIVNGFATVKWIQFQGYFYSIKCVIKEAWVYFLCVLFWILSFVSLLIKYYRRIE